jgi:hypothetical protein
MKLLNLSHRLARPAMVSVLVAAFPLAAVALTGGPVQAKYTPTPTPTSTAEPDATPAPPAISSLTPAVQAQHLATLKTRGDAEINRRLTNLNAALTTVQAVTTLTASDKSTLVSQIQAEISGLTTLKTKLDADTTLAAGRTDVQSIVNDYRVYVLMLPKARLSSAFDRLDVVETKLTNLEGQLQSAITAAQTAGKNVTTMQTILTDMRAKTTAIASLSSGQVATLLALQPSDYNTDHTVLESYRTTLGTAQTDAKAAATDAASIIQALGARTAASPSPTASPAK